MTTERTTAERTTTGPVLETFALTRRFGGLAAVDQVAIELNACELHAVIGPNGAGKSTLINLLSGDLKPTSGRIRFAGREIGGLPAHRIAGLGIGRSYQKTNILTELTVLENVRLAAQARYGEARGLLRPADRESALIDHARQALDRVGLRAEARSAGSLSHGGQRQLEIAMTLATDASVLLLDEPLAGMGPEETQHMTALLRQLARDHAVLLVEHDMDVVFAVADRLTVMVNGKVLASGAPEAIRRNAAVREAYLGEAVA
ncbi:MAG TPA: ABC transporter ATP-binding protein [Kiloniellales bacterium]|nr:ABC transporter ATP-binding protein [Kiloniellales bacterium]